MANLAPIPPGVDLPQLIAMLNQNFAELTTESITKITRDETGKRRIISGRLPDGTYGTVISNEGYDVVDDIFNA